MEICDRGLSRVGTVFFLGFFHEVLKQYLNLCQVLNVSVTPPLHLEKRLGLRVKPENSD